LREKRDGIRPRSHQEAALVRQYNSKARGKKVKHGQRFHLPSKNSAKKQQLLRKKSCEAAAQDVLFFAQRYTPCQGEES
jgi:hypothetical protein